MTAPTKSNGNSNGGRPHYRLPRWLEYRLYVWFDLIPNEWAVRHLEVQYRYWEALIEAGFLIDEGHSDMAAITISKVLRANSDPASAIPAPPTY